MLGSRIVCTFFESLSQGNGKELKAKEFLSQIGITHELKEPLFSQISMNISQIVSFI
jgi:adenine C2-methylase RlmN of 23S rRNA A2503 and tRNA A37